jgi:hypothetical protein
LSRPAHDAAPLRVAALDCGGGQEYLAYQRGSRRQIPQRGDVQVFHGGVMIAGGQRDPTHSAKKPITASAELCAGKPVREFINPDNR